MPDTESIPLLERFRSRDESALGDLYDLVGARAYGLSLRVVRDGTVAAEVTRNAFATLWDQADQLEGSIEGLLLTIVHRRAVHAARAEQRAAPFEGNRTPTETTPSEATPSKATPSKATPSKATPSEATPGGATLSEPASAPSAPDDAEAVSPEAQERAREVQAALQVLPETQREVVLLAYFDGLSQQDIATRLEVPLETVKSRLRLAMQRLRYEFTSAPAAELPSTADGDSGEGGEEDSTLGTGASDGS